MCLKVFGRKPYTANSKTFCFKVLVEDGEGKLMTPYIPTLITTDIINGKSLFEAFGNPSITKDDGDYWYATQGYIHTYEHLRDAQECAERWKSHNINAYVYRCAIPCGRHYYCGTDMSGDGGYISKAIRFIEKIY